MTQHPKHPPEHDDPSAEARVRAILDSPSYRIAEQDADFIACEAARASRLQLDYLKAETELAAHGIGHAIVVFGGTRIPHPDTAHRHLASCTEALARAPGDAACEQALAAASSIVAKSPYYEVARAFGRLVAERAFDRHGERMAILTGGGPGLMEAANRGAWDGGGKSVGLNITLPQEQFPNPYLTPGLCFRFHYFAMRKLHFLHRARALVAFPGGFGTFDELFETLVLLQTRKIAPLPVVLVGRSFWDRAVDFEFLAAEGVIAREDLGLFVFAETAQDIFDHIDLWYRKSGRPLFAEAGEEAP
jgi:uncharacterized protein (TIGR00730 family)